MSILLGNLGNFFEGFVEGATSNELSVLEGVAKQAKKDYDTAKKAYDNAKKAYDNAKTAYGNANKKSLKSCADSAKKPTTSNKNKCSADTVKTDDAKSNMDGLSGIMNQAKGNLDAKKKALDAANKAVADYKKAQKSTTQKSNSNRKSKKNRSKKNRSKKNKNDLKKCKRDKAQCGVDLGKEKQKVVKLMADNNRLITKNNSLLDTVQYYRKNLFGSSSLLGSMLGYKDSTVQANQEIDQLKHKEVGPEQGSPPPQRQGFENKEGFDSMDAAYKSVSTQNAALENQINTKRNNYSVDDQVYMNMAGKRNTLIYVNSILMWVFYAVVTICSIYIAIDPTMSTEKKFVVFKLVWLFVVILEIAEYLLYYAAQYAKAFLTGVPYSFENYWTYTLTF